MENIALLLVLLASIVNGQMEFKSLEHIQPSASSETQKDAAEQLIARVTQQHAKYFKVQVDRSIGPEYKDTFKLKNGHNSQSDDTIIEITGTTGVAVAMGYYYYLKNYCNSHISWAGNQVPISDIFQRH